jgi:hypothetical protein
MIGVPSFGAVSIACHSFIVYLQLAHVFTHAISCPQVPRENESSLQYALAFLHSGTGVNMSFHCGEKPS